MCFPLDIFIQISFKFTITHVFLFIFFLLSESYALLPIICIVILAQISTTSGRTLHGRKQILHSLENRLQHHKQVMQYERELSPIHGIQLHRRHHLNVRSTKMTTCSALDSMRKQANTSRRTLMDKIDEFVSNSNSNTSI